MKADLVITSADDDRPTMQELLTLLKNNHVVSGILQKKLQDIVAGSCGEGRHTVAAGKAAIPGTPGHLEWCIDLSKAGKPRELEDGRVNLRDLQTNCNVTTKQRLVRIVPPVQGTPGMTVFGTPVQPKPLQPLLFTAGKGTSVDEKDPELICSAIDGAVTFDGRVLQVVNSRIINGDVDYSTGNVAFRGDVKINGSVRAGFSVDVTGDVFVGGNIEETTITSGGSVTVLGGAIGSGNGSIRSTDTIALHHASQFMIVSEKEVRIEEDALHCSISTDGGVKAKSIIGGTVTAQAVSADCIGSDAEVRTVIDVARKERLSRERYDLLKRYGNLAARKAQEFEKIFFFVRDGMDEKGYLKSFEEQNLASLKHNTLESIEACRTIQERLEKIDRMEEAQGEASITAGVVYPNTMIKFGFEDRLVRSKEKNVRLKSGRG